MKRLFDLVLSLLLLVVLAPVFLLLYFVIRIKLGPSVIFKQKRPGLNEKIFTIYKFRTMTNQKDVNGHLMPDEKRLTRFGKFLRATSLDELLQLFNVLKGDMSFVGPRALLVEYLPYYNHVQKKRHIVKPGLTGWAQVNGRNAISWEQKFEYDVWYVEYQSFLLDMKIMLLTVAKVLKRTGISPNEHVIMPRFDEYEIKQNRDGFK